VGQLLGQIGQLFNYIITLPIFNVLMLLYHLFGSMALSIIVLTLIVRLALFPLTLKQLKSTKATQAIQPLIADVRKKYKDQKEQYAAMQAIYKEYGVNPVAGCLPLLIQLPILYGLFFALREGLNVNGLPPLQYLHDLNQAIYPFLPKFLIPPDPYMIWFGGAINLGKPDPTHILPVLAGLATFFTVTHVPAQNKNRHQRCYDTADGYYAVYYAIDHCCIRLAISRWPGALLDNDICL